MGLSWDWLRGSGGGDFTRPRRFDYNMLVIGGGSAGLVSAYIAAALKAKVGLIEAERMGGDCLYTGCVPSKTLIRSAKLMHDIAHAQRWGLSEASARVDFAAIMARVQSVIADIEPHDSPERYESLGVACLSGRGVLRSPWEVELGGQRLTARSIVIATGARPHIPDIPGLREAEPFTSETIWGLREQPSQMVVLGAGPIGCEMAQAFARLGTQVTLIDHGDRVMRVEDPWVSAMVRTALESDGVRVLTGTEVERVSAGEVHVEGRTLPYDALLVAAGRRANTEGLGLEALGIGTDAQGRIEVDEYLCTRHRSVLACGDVIAPWQFTHAASHEAWYCAINGLFGSFWRSAVSYRALPWCTFVDPEVARVGLNEQEASARGVPFELSEFEFAQSDRARAEGRTDGRIRVLTRPGKDEILGVTIAGPEAGELIAEFTLAKNFSLGLNKILGTVHVYPTLSEVNKSVAGVWRRQHQPAWALGLLARFHRWRR